MENFADFMHRLAQDEEGQDMVEYGLILGLVSVVAVIAVTATGTTVNDFWVAIQGVIESLPIP